MLKSCENVISLKQYGPTCWFNSILMAILYSDGSRKLLLEKSKKWNKKILLFKTIDYILKNKYLRTDSTNNDYKYFDKIRPEYLLDKLYEYNRKKFIYDLKKHKGGFKSELYIRKVYKLLGVKVLYLDVVCGELYYSLYNNINDINILDKKIEWNYKFISEKKVKEKFENPDIIILTNYKDNCKNIKIYPNYYKVDNKSILYKTAVKMANELVVDNGDKYVKDSVLLSNWNKDIGGHSIAGITCKKKKYVYNGWTRTTLDPNIKNINSEDINVWEETLTSRGLLFYHNKHLKQSVWKLPDNSKIIKMSDIISIPCELMKYNWDVNKNSDFCLNPKKCILDKMNPEDLCFSFNKGHRCIIYVKKDIKIDKLDKFVKKCPDEKVLNPLTNRCIKIKTINKVRKNPLSKPEKPDNKCAEGKVINPKTGRCIKITPVKPDKKCPEGKVINPLTNRCIKIK